MSPVVTFNPREPLQINPELLGAETPATGGKGRETLKSPRLGERKLPSLREQAHVSETLADRGKNGFLQTQKKMPMSCQASCSNPEGNLKRKPIWDELNYLDPGDIGNTPRFVSSHL